MDHFDTVGLSFERRLLPHERELTCSSGQERRESRGYGGKRVAVVAFHCLRDRHKKERMCTPNRRLWEENPIAG